MPQAHFRFYAELNDFLLPERRAVTFAYDFEGRSAIKDMVEAIGVPHPEVDLILVNGVSVDWAYIVQPEDRISVYPMFEAFDITPLIRLRPQPLREPKFLLDTHLGKLATYLRLLGFDTLYFNDCDDDVLAQRSANEQRILLTRDRGLLKRKLVTHGYCVRSSNSRAQLKEVLARFDLRNAIAPFRRCLRCNRILEPIEKQAIAHRLQPGTLAYYDTFYRCTGCDQLYWPGSHYERLGQFIDETLRE